MPGQVTTHVALTEAMDHLTAPVLPLQVVESPAPRYRKLPRDGRGAEAIGEGWAAEDDVHVDPPPSVVEEVAPLPMMNVDDLMQWVNTLRVEDIV
jgi:hypothetical protein